MGGYFVMPRLAANDKKYGNYFSVLLIIKNYFFVNEVVWLDNLFILFGAPSKSSYLFLKYNLNYVFLYFLAKLLVHVFCYIVEIQYCYKIESVCVSHVWFHNNQQAFHYIEFTKS